jgi:hypothetical protein
LITLWIAEPGVAGGIVITTSVSGTETLLLPVVIGIIVLVIIAALLLKRSRGTKRAVVHDEEPDFDYGAAIHRAPVPVSASASPREDQKRETSHPPGINVLEGCTNITECLDALVRKFSLESFTIATCDGLVFVSSGGDTAPDDAAKYSEIFYNDPLSETPGVILFGLNHKGSDLVGIIRTPSEVTQSTLQKMENDTKDILNRWI